ncbi:unnamed protein product [Peronospora farinosa]|uniref:Phosphoglycerate kinase n=1 Tax=Peronospora farinosa TaxID=134698 RepID=A0AAV0TF75_9STRA|nr:unnamed protein product [Peronospora farinosa]
MLNLSRAMAMQIACPSSSIARTMSNVTPAIITDDTRIRAVLPTLKLLQSGACTVLCSHLGRPDGETKNELRLTPVATRLGELLGSPIINLDDCVGPQVDVDIEALATADRPPRNVCFYRQETKNDPEFGEPARSAELISMSMTRSARSPSLTLRWKVDQLHQNQRGRVFDLEGARAPVRCSGRLGRPLGAIVGGAKVSTKIPVLKPCRKSVTTL